MRQQARFLSWVVLLGLMLGCGGEVKKVRNLVDPGQSTGRNLRGDLRVLVRPLAPEGSEPVAQGVIEFVDGSSQAVFNLGRVISVTEILVQADNRSSLQVDVSEDGRDWHRIWDIPTVLTGTGIPPMGLRSRTLEVERGIASRYLRVTPAIEGGAKSDPELLARLVVVDDSRVSLSTLVDRSRSGTPLLPWIDLRRQTMLYIFLAAAALVLVTWLVTSAGKRGAGKLTRSQRALAWGFVGISLLAWPNFLNFHWQTGYHAHEFFHYYLGAKYNPELDYTRLYSCTVLAQAENGDRNLPAQIRDLRTNRIVSTEEALRGPELCKSQFSEPRWQAFREDVDWFRQRTSDATSWARRVTDHGFNAPPSWLVVARPIASLVPLSDTSVTLLALLDLALLSVAGWLFYRTFGLIPFLIAVSFFCLNPIADFRYTGGAFLRYDWLVLICLGIVALRRGRQFQSGLLLMFSSLLRVFPGVILAGLAIRVLADCVATRSLKPLKDTKRLAAGALVCLLVILPLSAVASGDLGAWSVFYENSQKHLENRSVNRVGLGPLLEAIGGGTADSGAEDSVTPVQGTDSKLVKVVPMTALLVGFLLASRGKPLWVTAVLSIGLIPFLVSLSNYYFVVLLFLAALWSVIPTAAYGLAVLGWLAWLPMGIMETRVGEYGSASVMVLIYGVLVLTMGMMRRESPIRDARRVDISRESAT